MSLWLIKRTDGGGNYRTHYDEAYGFVISANGEEHARQLVAQEAGDEGHVFWLDPAKATANVIDDDEPYGVILRDFNAA